MAGFGVSPFGVGVFGTDTPASTVRESGQIVSSRKIDPLGRIVQKSDDSASFEGMSDTLQRAYIYLKTGRRRTDKILASFDASERRRVRDLLKPLTNPHDPVLRIDSIEIDETTSGAKVTKVSVTDLTNGARAVIVAPSNRFY